MSDTTIRINHTALAIASKVADIFGVSQKAALETALVELYENHKNGQPLTIFSREHLQRVAESSTSSSQPAPELPVAPANVKPYKISGKNRVAEVMERTRKDPNWNKPDSVNLKPGQDVTIR